MLPNDLLADLARDFYRGNVALWIGPEWDADADELNELVTVSWLGIWSESQNSRLLEALKTHWSGSSQLARRSIIEVTGRLEESLGSYFSFADICPFFFLRGRGGSWEGLPAREQRRARDEQIDEVGRLGSSVLFFDGYSRADQVLRLVHDELPPGAGVRIVVCGLAAGEEETLAQRLSRVPTTFRLRVFPGPLISLLREVQRLVVTAPPAKPAILAGTAVVDLAPLLERENPIDQDFFVLTTYDTRPPSLDENEEQIVEHLLSGAGVPWRAFGHDLHWRRNDRIIELVFQQLARIAGSPGVVCFNIPAETGSGLTVLLAELAFRCAERGYPALVNRPGPHEIDYDGLRTFLEDLATAEPSCPASVIVFDDSDNGFDTAAGLKELPLRLARDGRHALIVRGVTIRNSESFDDSFRRSRGVFTGGGKVTQQWLDYTLRASLTPEEQESLAAWAGQHWPEANSAELRQVMSGWGADWALGGDPPPLLVCLYFLLRDRITHSSALGEHIVARIRHTLEGLPEVSGATGAPATATDGRLSPEDLAQAVQRLQARFRGQVSRFGEDEQPTRRDIAQAFLSLSALGCLRIPVSRTVLGDIADIPADRVSQSVVLLERSDMVRVLFSPLDDEAHGAWARDAFYTTEETVGVRHPSYGRLALEWLRSEPGRADLAYGFGDGLREFESGLNTEGVADYPLQLLVPIFKRLRPSRADVEFVERVCVRLLRLQRVRGSRYHEWLFRTNQADSLLTVLAALPEQVARQSSVILHTRGMTRYKSCSRVRSLDDCRRRYETASTDLQLAFERAQQEYRGEQPANVVTSHGLLYLGWAKQEQERTAEGGDPSRARELGESARRYLREGLRLRHDNPYAAYGIAESLIYDCENARGRPIFGDEEFADRLAEALDLLEMEPEASFEEEWEELKVRAIELLYGPLAAQAIGRLKADGHELGYALEALRTLGGEIPYGPSEDTQAETKMREAWGILAESASSSTKASALASFIRYALFSSMPERLQHPGYSERFALIAKLQGSKYLERPLWLYDYGMLALQNERYREATEAFRGLRRGGRFLEVPLERSSWFVSSDRPHEPRAVTLRVLNVNADGKGWARVEDPRGIVDPVPFAERTFLAVGIPARPGAVIRGRLRIRPAGPAAEPLRSDRDVRR